MVNVKSMEQVRPIISFFFLLLHFFDAIAQPITCSAPALHMKNEIAASLHGVLVALVQFNGSPYPVNYPSNGPFTLMKYEFVFKPNKALVTKTWIDKKGKNCIFRKLNFIMDDTKAIFKAADVYFERNVTSLGEESKTTDLKINIMPELKYALVHVDQNNHFFIFEDCNRRYAWVLMKNSVISYYLAQRKDPTSVVFKDKIRAALENLHITGKAIDVNISNY